MPCYDVKCETCENFDVEIMNISEIDGWKGECKSCRGVTRRLEVPLKAPAGKVEGGYVVETARLQQSLKERFMKKEVDDVRHKFGALYDDSVRSAAAQRIKESGKT